MKLIALLTAATLVAPACGLVQFKSSTPTVAGPTTNNTSSMADARARKRQRMARQDAADRERLARARAARNRRIAARNAAERSDRAKRVSYRKLVDSIDKDLRRFRKALASNQPLLAGEVAIVETHIEQVRLKDNHLANRFAADLFEMRFDSARITSRGGESIAAMVGGKVEKHGGVQWKQRPSNAMKFTMRKGRCYLGVIYHPRMSSGSPFSNYTVDQLRLVTRKPDSHVGFMATGSRSYSLRGGCAHRNTKAAWTYRTNNQDRRRMAWTMTIVSFSADRVPGWLQDRYAYHAPAACDVTSFKNLWRYPLPGLNGFVGNQPVALTSRGFLAISGRYVSGVFDTAPQTVVSAGAPALPPKLCRVMTADKLSKKAFKCMARASGKYRAALNRAGGAYDRATSRESRGRAGNRYDDLEARSLEAQARCMPLMDKLQEWVAKEKNRFAQDWVKRYRPAARAQR